MTPTLVIHGGAGLLSDELIEATRQGAAEAVAAGLAVLRRGGSALDAVQAAVRSLEDCPEFNAGTGSVLTRDGTLEADAALMDGDGLRFGAVGAVPNAGRAIELARAVLDDGEHCLLCGEAAWLFARERGLQPDDPARIVTARARARLEEERARRARGEHAWPIGGSTVGACAIDARGHVAAATSTGGITFKRPGRVGDTPLPGCGTYADDLGGAASATGHGETLLRVLVTRVAVEGMRAGFPAEQAAWAAVDELGSRVRGTGGLVCVDREGRVGIAHNTPRMSWGTASLDAPEPVTGVSRGRPA